MMIFNTKTARAPSSAQFCQERRRRGRRLEQNLSEQLLTGGQPPLSVIKHAPIVSFRGAFFASLPRAKSRGGNPAGLPVNQDLQGFDAPLGRTKLRAHTHHRGAYRK